MRALLDVNVLVALLDAMHVHHRIATDWLASHQQLGWASCPLTQNGCVRLLSLSAYRNAHAPADVARRLGAATSGGQHEFWPDSVSLLDAGRARWDHVLTSRQVTDAYLLALAVSRGGRFVTLDRGIGVKSIAGAQAKHLLTLA